ncbi:glycosyltransferase family 4 protein [candidate division KSB1 bacterium]|nr:glycosyltransferase family 4 protein [candidate division KSB1 bacterium]
MRKQLKICFVSQNIYPLLNKSSNMDFIGGAELQQAFIGHELAKRGHRICYITLNHGQGDIEEIESFKVISTFKPNEGLPILRFFYPRLYKIWKALCKSDADIYYVRCACFILAPVVFYAYLNNKKVVYCGAYDTDFEPEKIALPYKRDKLMYFWGLKRCDAIIVQNKVQQKTLQKYFNLQGQIVHNGFSKVKKTSPANKHILWVATILPRKNPNLFINLAKRFPKEKFVMVGGNFDQEQQFKQDITKQAEKVPNLEFKGYLPFEKVIKEFIKAKLFISTSNYEGFPNTFLQAWSNGIPVISFVDPDDLIKENGLGMRVQHMDEMTEKVNEFLENNLRFSPKVIKNFFKKNLTIERTVDKHEEIFHRLVV